MSRKRHHATDCRQTERVLRGEQPVVEDNDKVNWLGHQVGAGSAKLDKALITGATMAQLLKIRGAAYKHICHLRTEHGLQIEEFRNEQGEKVYRFSLNQP